MFPLPNSDKYLNMTRMSANDKIMNVNIVGSEDLITPTEMKLLFPITDKVSQLISKSRTTVQNILDGKDKRLFVVVGPCSIHDPKAAEEYATRLVDLHNKLQDKLFIIMRVYFEKPRTTIGWKGLINDPNLDDSFDIQKGLKLARKLLIEFAELGLPTGTEALDPITPQYYAELITWAAIGARTTESQTHREMASGLSMPIGFKNGTDGGIQVAVDAMKSAQSPHHFLGISQEGKICKFATRGNRYGHVVLRGGGGKSNYDAASIQACEELLAKSGLIKKIVVDCSHANSNKDHRNQPQVFMDVLKQVRSGNKSICGLMLESNLHEGNQSIPQDLSQLQYGISVTDKCIDWQTTEKLLLDAYRIL